MTLWRQKKGVVNATHSVNNGSLILSPPRTPRGIRLNHQRNGQYTFITANKPLAVYTDMMREKQNENIAVDGYSVRKNDR
ncbi:MULTISPECIES: hypothetical protein [unclassified Brenneria]|uniref:hypothetical protein n=1 Tax=unclassified Brenneria TaxID=2634434 RepID=UPI0029C3F93C|nr:MULTISPECIES: hypothetical protein [unclassified Brenneria]MDX5629040.1 hypothetical protein [Brenneria sp. L3-3Z]MDX5696179.1 hypothetical protein [Brenneria sp. L4-2C]MEE3660972.1 hypothetical protein [Brenneria sp. g21c3]